MFDGFTKKEFIQTAADSIGLLFGAYLLIAGVFLFF